MWWACGAQCSINVFKVQKADRPFTTCWKRSGIQTYTLRVDCLQELAKLQTQVEANERGVEGFENNVEELRAAGRMEAMQDLMQLVFDTLVRSATNRLPGCLATPCTCDLHCS